MVKLDPRTPVLVGGGQVNRRGEDEPLDPIDLLAAAARAAAADAGSTGMLDAIDSVRVVSILSWRYFDPGALVAERLGLRNVRQSIYTTAGGNTPQSLVNRTCIDIQAGAADVVLLGGAEAWRTRMAFRAHGERPEWTKQADGTPPAESFGGALEMGHPAELAKGIALPVQTYPLFEQALRHAEGRTIDEQLIRISELWARFSEVAAANPNAWIQQASTPETIRTAGPDNRWIGFPYPKLMNSNNAVEQGAALLLCSAEAAKRLGVPRDRWVFPLAGTDSHDADFLSVRGDLYSSPGIRVAGLRVLDLAGIGIDDVAHVDIYSCFPSAVQIAANELGLSVDAAISGERPLTVTGGLSFAGGPWNNYVTHSIATMATRLREDAGSIGLCTANGGHLTKHALGLYSTEPSAHGFQWADVQNEVDAVTTQREVVGECDGEVTVESWTVMHDREGQPEIGLVAALLDDGRRAWGTTHDAETLKAMTVEEFIGRRLRLPNVE